MTVSADAVVEEIRQAFPARRQGRFLPLVNSEGDEPLRVIAAFDDKDDWTTLAPEWLDKVPSGLGSALSFLADEAICFYIPAYIVADMTTALQMVDPTFTLTHRQAKARPYAPAGDSLPGGDAAYPKEVPPQSPCRGRQLRETLHDYSATRTARFS
jgi:hypothetical protein